ncbi:MAG: hypothetical protein M3N91_03700 [Pseudomonadota bacterium]|nr:hypothetical protein [Pseudomonadota bacterium]
MSHFHSDAEIERIVRGLIDRSLPKSSWTHAAHFAVALWLVRWRGAHATSEMPLLIRAYNEATAVPNTDTGGYHETITLASLRAVRSWLADRPEMPLHEVLKEMLETSLGRSDWLLTYWSRPVLFSVTARKAWVEPDLRPLPFGGV